jgi:MFS family permease
VFVRSVPLISTSFINKCGNIGMDLLPMLLIQRGFTGGQSSVVMGLVKAFILVGVFAGGWISDRLGLRITILISFAAAGAGMAGIPFADSLFWMAIAASIAQLGQSMFQSPARLLLTESVQSHEVPESFAWLRTANNFGQIMSYGISAVFSSLGVPILMWFDSATSWIAVGAGTKFLPRPNHASQVSSREGDGLANINLDQWKNLLSVTLILGFFNLFYDLFMVGVAGKCQVLYGASGLKLFSEMMIVNCAFCAVLSVRASKLFDRPAFVFPVGMFLLVSGVLVACVGAASIPLLFLGIFLNTAGEIIFASLSQTALIRALPAGKRRGTIYSYSLVLQNIGRILGAGLAFSWIVYRPNPFSLLAPTGAVAMVLVFLLSPRINALFDVAIAP